MVMINSVYPAGRHHSPDEDAMMVYILLSRGNAHALALALMKTRGNCVLWVDGLWVADVPRDGRVLAFCGFRVKG
jgi:hypothetical protein